MDQAFWVVSPGTGELRTVALVEPGPDEVTVRAVYGGISRGTERLVFHGCVPENQHQAMRCPHQEGDFSFPVKYGYIVVGTLETPEDRRGERVFLLHPHQSRMVVPASAVVSLPEGLDPALAVLAPNMETAINAVWDAGVEPGSSATVIGAGVVGLLVAWRLQQEGVAVEVVDINPRRAAMAARLGLPLVSPEDARTDRPLIVHASASEAGLQRALELASVEGTILELSWYGDRSVSLPLGAHFHSKRLTIQSSQVGTVSAGAPEGTTHASRMHAALTLLACHPELSVLITEESAFADLPSTMVRVTSSEADVLCHRIRYPGDA